jgi:hypothetical protein
LANSPLGGAIGSGYITSVLFPQPGPFALLNLSRQSETKSR